MCKTIAIANQKGGVGKTTTTFNLGAYLARASKTVLLVDLDPQGNLSSYAGFEKDDRPTITDLFNGAIKASTAPLGGSEGLGAEAATPYNARDSILASVRHNEAEGLDYIPSTLVLSGAEAALFPVMSRENVLRNILVNVTDLYEYILIDCPPSLGVLSINALTASDEILVPVQAQNFALDGIIQLMGTYNLVRNTTNPRLSINGFLLTMVNHTVMSREVENVLRSQFSGAVYVTSISDSTTAPASSVQQHCLKGKLGDQYQNVAKELIEREKAS